MTPSPPEAGSGTPALPPRDPHPLLTHVLVDVTVAFLLVAFLFFVVGLPFWLTIVVSVAGGAAAAPWTRRAEERALAARRPSNGQTERPSPGGPHG